MNTGCSLESPGTLRKKKKKSMPRNCTELGGHIVSQAPWEFLLTVRVISHYATEEQHPLQIPY